jgi:hypothetical protein
MDGTPIDLDKLRSLAVIGRRTRDTVREGRAHPETGVAFKATTDELGNTVTEHGDRQDVNIRAPLVRMTARQTEERQP